jgi:hypothetical protein
MSCFPVRTNKSKQSNNRNFYTENDDSVSSGYETAPMFVPTQHVLVHSINLFDYNTCQWTNIVEQTYWDGYRFYNVYVRI